MTNKWTHPETGAGELFISNMTHEQFESFDWTSKRKGDASYDGMGRRLGISNWFPVFVREIELSKRRKTVIEVRRKWRELHGQPSTS